VSYINLFALSPLSQILTCLLYCLMKKIYVANPTNALVPIATETQNIICDISMFNSPP